MVSILDVPDEKLTPGMRQYKDAKLERPDCLILLRMGDFYEIFYEDAEIAARDLEITLTSRGKGEKRAPLAGVPFHALEPYLGKLISKGHKVAIVEQLEDPKKAKGLVKRGIVRVVTPGTVIESSILDAKSNNYLMSLQGFVDSQGEDAFSFSVCDLSTGELVVGGLSSESSVFSEIMKRRPSELIIPESMMVNSEFVSRLAKMDLFLSPRDDFHFRYDNAAKVLFDQVGEKKVSKSGVLSGGDDSLDEKLGRSMVSCAGALVEYLLDTQKNSLSHIKDLIVASHSDSMQLDVATLRNLELLENVHGETGRGTLLSVVDRTVSSMGSRLMKKVIRSPLVDLGKITVRLDAVECLNRESLARDELIALLKQLYDMERLIARVNYGNASPKDLLSLKESLDKLPVVKSILSHLSGGELITEIGQIADLAELFSLLDRAIREDAPLTVREGGIFARGFHSELDSLIDLSLNSKQALAAIEAKEKESTGIDGMKISFNRVFGYFIEVRKKDVAKVPDRFIRKQTTANAERYITNELKVLEEKILSASERMHELEYRLFQDLLASVGKFTSEIQDAASKLAMLDVLCSFSVLSVERRYVRPDFVDSLSGVEECDNGSSSSSVLEIVNGRHPVVETLVEEFVPNSVRLLNGEIMIITGPNTSGKSTVMRQTALIVLLAQIGCFVPAASCKLSVVDRIFTRVGAHDDLSSGQSTFMVEMMETATIMREATSSSLVVLDEIGRGTSTFDGVAIAWSCVEYLYNNIGALVMFATHYHVLNQLADSFDRVVNYNVAVREVAGEIVYLRKLVEGACDKSHGVHVARLAGMPNQLVIRAQEIQQKLVAEDEMAKKLVAKKIESQKGLGEF